MLKTARSPRRSSIPFNSRYSHPNEDGSRVRFCTRRRIFQVDNHLITATVFKNAGANDDPAIFYDHHNGRLFRGDSIQWMKSLPDASVDLIFADPPYNIKKADWDDFASHPQCARVARPAHRQTGAGYPEGSEAHGRRSRFRGCVYQGRQNRRQAGQTPITAGQGPPEIPQSRNPAKRDEVWSGRGRQPKWVQAALAGGENLSDLAISGGSAEAAD